MRVGVILLPGSSHPHLPRGGAHGPHLELIAPSAAELPDGLDAITLLGGPPPADPAAPPADQAATPPPIVFPIVAFALQGGAVLGVGAGFQALCAVSLLPGALVPAAAPVAVPPRALILRVEGQPTPFTRAIPAARLLRLADAPVHWRYEHPAPESLEQAGQVVFRYVDDEGGVTPEADPTASARNIAGVCDPEGRVVGLAAYPAEPLAALLHPLDGTRLLDSLRDHLDAATRRQEGRG